MHIAYKCVYINKHRSHIILAHIAVDISYYVMYRFSSEQINGGLLQYI